MEEEIIVCKCDMPKLNVEVTATSVDKAKEILLGIEPLSEKYELTVNLKVFSKLELSELKEALERV